MPQIWFWIRESFIKKRKEKEARSKHMKQSSTDILSSTETLVNIMITTPTHTKIRNKPLEAERHYPSTWHNVSSWSHHHKQLTKTVMHHHPLHDVTVINVTSTNESDEQPPQKTVNETSSVGSCGPPSTFGHHQHTGECLRFQPDTAPIKSWSPSWSWKYLP